MTKNELKNNICEYYGRIATLEEITTNEDKEELKAYRKRLHQTLYDLTLTYRERYGYDTFIIYYIDIINPYLIE